MEVNVNDIIYKFIDKMEYLNNQHVLGIFFYGSFLNGTNHPGSDIDLHIIFDNSKPFRIIRGVEYIDDLKVEYFEKPLWDCYATVFNGFSKREGAWLQIFGTSEIIYEKAKHLKNLQKYTQKIYSKPFPKLTDDEARERKAVIDNRMERFQQLVDADSPTFDYYCDLTIEKIRKFYHDLNGLASIATTKVFRTYTDEDYRLKMQPLPIPEKEFITRWLDIISDKSSKAERLKKLEDFYTYVTRNIELPKNHRINIQSRNLGPTATLPFYNAELSCDMSEILEKILINRKK